jgi:hypothetical protein
MHALWAIFLLLLGALAVSAVACSDDDGGQRVQIVTPVPTNTPEAPEATSTPKATNTAKVEPTEVPTEKPTERPPAATNTPSRPAPTPEPERAPDSGRWIDVNVSSLTVQLMEDKRVVRSIGPVAVGEQIDTGAYLSTSTGLFHVYSLNKDLAYDPPYDTYISDWVGFDPSLDNGFHSFLKDAKGNVVNAGTGRISNGCIRTGEPDVIYAYAEIGMPVWVHY